MASVELISWRDARQEISARIRSSIPPNRKLRVVEAGCGRQWGLEVDVDRCVITGIDNDRAALRTRVEQHRDIHKPIEGDVQDPGIVEQGEFDLVYSSFVLEHLPKAEAAASGWVDWLDQGGLLVLIVPDSRSAYGFISSHTPHLFHIWFYRRVLGRQLAGTPGHAPYPVSYSPLLTVSGLKQFAEDHDLKIERFFAIGEMRRGASSRDKLKNGILRLARRTLALISGRRLKWRHDNLAVVMKKRSPGPIGPDPV